MLLTDDISRLPALRQHRLSFLMEKFIIHFHLMVKKYDKSLFYSSSRIFWHITHFRLLFSSGIGSDAKCLQFSWFTAMYSKVSLYSQIKWCLCFYFWILLYWKIHCGFFHGLGHFESHRPKHSKRNYNVCNDMSIYFSPTMNSLENTSASVSIQDNPMKSIALISCTLDGRGFWTPLSTGDDTSVFWL